MENFQIKESLFFEKFNTSKEKLRKQNLIYDLEPLATRLGQVTNGTSGNDVYFYNHGTETYNGFDGIDIISIALPRDRFSLETSRGNVASLRGVVAGYPATISLDDVEILRFSDQDVVLDDGPIRKITEGNTRNVLGTTLDNKISGHRLKSNVIYSLDGSDTLRGGLSTDALYGGFGSDSINGNSGHDYLSGGKGGDSIFGHLGNDVIFGGFGNDDLIGGIGKDTISGGEGRDTISGGNGKDIISGGKGRDIMEGGRGFDTLIGGKGDDVFVLNNHENTLDVVRDFEVGEDVLKYPVGLTSEAEVTSSLEIDDGNSAVISFSGNVSAILRGVSASELEIAAGFIF